MNVRPIRLGIVDDHPITRDGMAELLVRRAGFEIAGLGSSVDDARRLLDTDIDVLLLDVRLADESGFAALDGRAGPPAVIILTAYDLPQYAAAAMRQGAAGFISKTARFDDIVATIRTVAGGGIAFSRRPEAGPPFSDRERDLLRELVEGRTNDEIGARLGIAVATVETHLRRMFEKAGVSSRTELATRAIREGWLELPSTRTE